MSNLRCMLCKADCNVVKGLIYQTDHGTAAICHRCMSPEGARQIGQVFGHGVAHGSDARTTEAVREVIDDSLAKLQLAFCQGVSEAMAQRFWVELQED